jgi:hypothetical protein
MLKATVFTGELRNLGGRSYVLWDYPLAGGLIEFSNTGPGEPTFVYDPGDPDVTERYQFTKTHLRVGAEAHGEFMTNPGRAKRS